MGIWDTRSWDTSTWSANRRRAIIVAPIFILMVGLGVLNWLIPGSGSNAAVPTAALPAPETAITQSTEGVEPLETPPLLGIATPWGVVGRGDAAELVATPAPPTSATATSAGASTVAAVPPGVTIQLLGPPGDSRFLLEDDISFYWSWPQALEANQRFAVYLRAGSDEWLLGEVERNNLGSAFRLRANPAELVAQPAQYEWFVRLEAMPTTNDATASGANAQVLVESEARSLFLAGG